MNHSQVGWFKTCLLLKFQLSRTDQYVNWEPFCAASSLVYQSDYTVGNGGQIFLSPGQAGGSVGRSGQPYNSRGSVRGMARGGKGLAHTFRSSGWYRGIYPQLFFSSFMGFLPQLRFISPSPFARLLFRIRCRVVLSHPCQSFCVAWHPWSGFDGWFLLPRWNLHPPDSSQGPWPSAICCKSK